MKAFVGNVMTTFEGLSLQQRDQLDQAFAVQIPGLFYQPRFRKLILSGIWDGKTHIFKKASSTLPTGLLSKALPMLPGCEIVNPMLQEEYDNWQRAKIDAQSVEVNGITLSADQRQAVISSVGNMRGILSMATNSGKTPVGAGIIKALRLPTLWLLHRKALLEETSTRLEAYLGMPVGKIGDGVHSSGALVDVAIDKSIDPKNNPANKKLLEKYQCVIFDEGHHLSCSTQQRIAKSLIAARFRILLSGSLPKDKVKIFNIMSMSDATVLYTLSNQDMVQTGWSAKPIITIKPIQYPSEVHGVRLYNFDYPSAYEYCIEKNELYHHIIADEVKKQVDAGITTLVFVDRIWHGMSLMNKLNDRKVDNLFLNGSTPSFARNEAMAKFRTGQLPCIISTNILDEGVDIPRIGSLILTSGGKSAIRVLQRVGRALRKKAKGELNITSIVDFDHQGNAHLEKHSQERLKIYKKEQFEIKYEEAIKVS